MKYQLIMLTNPILVSDEEIKPTEPYINNGVVFYADSVFDEGNNPNNSNPIVTDYNFKIIAGIEGLPSLDLSAIAERIGWVDVEKLVKSEYLVDELSFIRGFRLAQSLNEKNFSQKNINSLIQWLNTLNSDDYYKCPSKLIKETILTILSLSQPKVFNVEIETDRVHADRAPNGWDIFPKITNNSIKILKVL